MAEYRDLYKDIRETGADLAGVAVDPPKSSEAVRQQLSLPFLILCDTLRQIVKPWGVFNSKEKGGIAEAAVFIVDRDGTFRFVSIDTMSARVPASAILEYLRAGMPELPANPARKSAFPAISNIWRGIGNAIRFHIRSPEE